MNFEIVPAPELSLAEQAKILSDAFAGYLIGSITTDATGLAQFLSAQGADLCYSRFVRTNSGALTSFGYIARTGNVPRLASMGTVPAGRRSGAAGHLLSCLMAEAKTRGDPAMVLEVFEQNGPALALYRQHKFREMTRLFGWRRKSDPAASGKKTLAEIPLLRAGRMRSPLEYPELPWQISRFAILKLPSVRAFAVDDACVIVSDPGRQPIRVHALLGFGGNDWRAGRIVLGAVLAEFPKSEFFAAQTFPEPFGSEIFEPLGFEREPLNQFLMRREL